MPTVNWLNRVITVPISDLTAIAPGIYEHDINQFRLALKSLEDDEGMPYPDTHRHNTTVTVGGVTLARVVEIINDYTVTYEPGLYAVNLVGANTNVSDVATVNGVSIRSGNSAGLIQVATGGGGSAPTALQNAAAVWGYSGDRTLTSSGNTAIATAVESQLANEFTALQSKVDQIQISGGKVIATIGSDIVTLPANLEQRILELWRLWGLDAANPASLSPTQRSVGSTTITISQSGDTVTLTRQP